MPSFTATIRKLVRSPEPIYTPLTPSASWHDAFHKWALIEVPSEVPGTPSTTEFAHWPAKKSKVRRSTPTRAPVEIPETSAEDASAISDEVCSFPYTLCTTHILTLLPLSDLFCYGAC